MDTPIQTLIHTKRKSRVHLHAWFWEVWGNGKTWMKPMWTQSEPLWIQWCLEVNAQSFCFSVGPNPMQNYLFALRLPSCISTQTLNRILVLEKVQNVPTESTLQLLQMWKQFLKHLCGKSKLFLCTLLRRGQQMGWLRDSFACAESPRIWYELF